MKNPNVSDKIALAEALQTLHKVLEIKCKRLNCMNLWGDRGTACTQLVGASDCSLLYIYEAGTHETMWPRYVYRLSGGAWSAGHVNAVREAIRLERMTANTRNLVEKPHVARPKAVAAHRLQEAGRLFALGRDEEAITLRDSARALLR